MSSVRRAAVRASALAVLLLLPAAAHAAPVTVTDPAGSGATATLSSAEVYPGQRVAISGTGFIGANPGGAGGVPLVAIKPYDIDTDWASGGRSSYAGPTSDAKIWFAPDSAVPGSLGTPGEWDGYIDIPTSLTDAGILPDAAGSHWFRVLSGVFSTGDNVTGPITFKLPFKVVDRVRLGLTGSDGTFQAGRTFRPLAQVTPKGLNFPASKPITATLDGATLAANSVTTVPPAGPGLPPTQQFGPAVTSADGTFPASTRLTIPAGTAPGTHQLTVSVTPDAGPAQSATYPVTVAPAATATLVTPAARPGGRIAFSLAGVVGVSGKGQKVAVVVNEAVLACVNVPDSGSITASALLPATLAAGPATVAFNTGTACRGQVGPYDDLPQARIPTALTVSATAPTVSVVPPPPAAPAAAIAGEGFPAGSTVSASVDGSPAGLTVTASGSGTFAARLPLSDGLAPGEHLATFSGGGATAVTLVTVTAPVAEATPTPTATPTPNATPTPSPAATPTSTPTPTPVPTPVAPSAKKLTLKGNTLTITLSGAAVKGTAITVRSAKKLKFTTKGKPKTVTFAKLTTSKTGAVKLRLTSDGKRALKRFGKVSVVITVTVPGAKAPTTKRITLRD